MSVHERCSYIIMTLCGENPSCCALQFGRNGQLRRAYCTLQSAEGEMKKIHTRLIFESTLCEAKSKNFWFWSHTNNAAGPILCSLIFMPLELIEHLLDHTNACKNCNHAHIFVAGTTLLEGTCNVLFSAVDSVFSVGVVIQSIMRSNQWRIQN